MLRLSSIISLCLVVLTLRCYAQNPEAERILKIIPSLKEDSVKVNKLIELGTSYLSSDINEAIKYGNQAHDLADKINYQVGLGYSYNLLGLCYSNQANYPESDINFKAGLAVFEKIKFKDGIAQILNNLGTIYDEMGDATKSLEYHLQSLKVAEEINNKKGIGQSLLNIGSLYAAKEPSGNRGLGYFLRALEIFEEIKDTEGLAIAEANTGEIYFTKGEYDSALVFFDRFVNMMKGDVLAYYGLKFIGEIYAEKGDFKKAFEYHNEAIELSESVGAKLPLAQSLISKAKSLRKQGNLKNSIENYRDALTIAEEIRARPEMKLAYEALAGLYSEVGDFKNAYTYESNLTQLKDTLYNSNEDKKIQQLQFNFEIEKKESQIQLQDATIQRQKIVTYAIAISGFLLLILAIGSYNRYKFVRRTNKIIQDERDRSKELLLNILPEETARELETNGSAQSRYYESATVLFTDFKGFSTIAGKLSPQELVAELNDYFMAFDEIMGKHNLEKIKTIGDAYMCAGGIPTSNKTHPLDAVHAALEMQDYMFKKNAVRKEKNLECWELRVGIHTGPIVAGVVGKKKYAYDIWGDTVNIASRMESNGEAGKVNISASTYQSVKEHYQCLYRGKISAKNIGDVDMYFIESKITKPSLQLA
jgi:adenylate cyclase